MRIAACQTPELLSDPEAALTCVEDFASRADADLVLFPECFLPGYLTTEEHVHRYAIALDSPDFAALTRRLAGLRPTIVLGLIERAGRRFHNTAVVLSRGVLLGAYRKIHIGPGEAIFTAGTDCPVFDLAGVRFGINICADTRFPEPAAAVAAQGAQVLLVPSQNMMRRENAVLWKGRHHALRAQRAQETGMWVISADVTGRRDEHRIGWGPTSALTPTGEVAHQVPSNRTGMITAEVG